MLCTVVAVSALYRELEDMLYLSGPHDASVLWNAMMSPLLPMTIFGAIWYQGNTSILTTSVEQHQAAL